MERVRVLLLGVILASTAAVNLFLAPQIYEPRPAAFSGPDLVEIPVWRGHAFGLQSWWLMEQFPRASFEHVGYGVPEGAQPGALPIGMEWSGGALDLYEVRLDDTELPFDVSGLDVRDIFYQDHKVSGEIRCQSDMYTEESGRCAYFVAWDERTQPGDAPVFVAVRTNATRGEEEMALIEKELFAEVMGVPLSEVPLMGELP